MRAALLALLLAACVHKEQLQLDASHAEHDQLAGNVSMRVDSAEHAKLDEHTIDTSGPVEVVHDVFGPDGGVAERTVTRWGGSKSENWLKQALNAEEHLQLDAGVLEEHVAAGEVHERESKETRASGGCMLGLGFYGALAIAGLCLAGGLYLKWRR